MDERARLQTITREFLKKMPIWDYEQQFDTELTQLTYEASQFIERVNERGNQINNLPKLNTTNKRKVLSPIQQSSDIVLIYKKTDEGYVRYEENATDGFRTQVVSKDPTINEISDLLQMRLEASEEVYAMLEPEKPWVRCTVISVIRRSNNCKRDKPFITIRVKSLVDEHNTRRYDLDKYRVARIQDHSDNLRPPKRVIAGTTRDRMMPGTIGYEPCDDNDDRYLVLMDDGSTSYFATNQVFPILGQSIHPWLDSRHTLRNSNPLNEAYLRYYIASYPRRHILAADEGDKLELMRHGSLVQATIVSLDCDTMKIRYKDGTEESIYRGSPRVMKRTDIVSRQLRCMRTIDNFHDTIIFNIHHYFEAGRRSLNEEMYQCIEGLNKNLYISKPHNIAKKSTGSRTRSPPRCKVKLDDVEVDENMDEIEEWNVERFERMKTHRCSPDCLNIPGVKTEKDIKDIVEEFRHCSDLKVPVLLGWKRRLAKIPTKIRHKIVVIYETPCGKIHQQAHNIRRYLVAVNSKLDMDYFSFDREVKLNRQLGEQKAYYYVENMAVDSKTKKPLENKNVSLMNKINEERLPEDFEYRNECFPHPELERKGFSFNLEFKSSCDCSDDCNQRSTCACHQLNEEFFGKNSHLKGTVDNQCQYKHKRLQSQISTGIFECNSGCSCSSRCSNRVVQNGMRFRLQVTKTLDKGWGVYTLDDIPAGAFITTYAAELLDDADQYGDSDMYFADLDYITVNERHKISDDEKSDEGVGGSESDEGNNKTSAKPTKSYKRKNRPRIEESDEDSQEVVRLDDNVSASSSECSDVYLPRGKNESRYPKRKPSNQQPVKQAGVREVKFKKIHDILGSHDYTLDARMQGNVGRFFNHSCNPNSFVQNVFIESHDLRFPVVAFFATRLIKGGDEITWNYNYLIDSINGRVIKCNCGAPNCTGRIL